MTPTAAAVIPRAECLDAPPACVRRAAAPEVIPNLDSYEEIIVAFSGGKDCLASILFLLELGVPRSKIHAHHHLVDGREGSTLFDWPCTEGYCSAVCAALGIAISFSWRRGGLEQEALRNDCATAPVMIPDEYVGHRPIGGDGPSGTRLKFPQQSADLSVRWCSSVAKISCMDAWITNDPRFRDGGRRLVITGERAEESPNRARYKVFEPHRSDLRQGIRYQRHVDHWRPVHVWTTSDVWAIIERHRVLPHPAYFLGWGRCSCRCCVFGSNDQWATVRAIAPEQFAAVVHREREFKVTIHRKRSVEESAALGTPYATDAQWVVIANSNRFAIPVIVNDWQLPAGAYGESCGPT
jgi:hypothetical protein